MIRSARTVYRHPILGLLIVLLLLALTGCGAVHAYLHAEDRVAKRLSMATTKAQLLDVMGKPDHEWLATDEMQLWEFSVHSRGQWVIQLFSCIYPPPYDLFCFLPLPRRLSYWAVLTGDFLCLAGKDEVLASSTCQGSSPNTGTPKEQPEATERAASMVSVDPVLAPPPIQTRAHRLAIIPLTDTSGYEFRPWLDHILGFWRAKHPKVVLVEKEALPPIPDALTKFPGGSDEESGLAWYGRTAGVDAVLAYRIYGPFSRKGPESSEGRGVPGSVEIRFVKVEVEGGTTLFHEVVRASTLKLVTARPPLPVQPVINFAHRVAVEHAGSYALAALAAAMGGNPLGVVPDLRHSEKDLPMLGTLSGSLAHAAGLKEGDKITQVNGRPFTWLDMVELPATLIIERAGAKMKATVGSR